MPPVKKGAPRRGLAVKNAGGRFRRANLLTSLVLVFPLLVTYQLAVPFLPSAMNGADLVTVRLLNLLGPAHYFLFNLALIVAFAVALAVLRKRQQVDRHLFLPVLLESGIYAMVMGVAIGAVMHAIGINPSLFIGAGAHPAAAFTDPKQLGLPARIVLSLGAGVHEEIAFRLLMLPAIAWFFQRVTGTGRLVALGLAFVISSAVFSYAHVFIGGEPFRFGVFVFRFFCGMVFATLFETRGFATASYTHALYDIWVLVFHG